MRLTLARLAALSLPSGMLLLSCSAHRPISPGDPLSGRSRSPDAGTAGATVVSDASVSDASVSDSAAATPTISVRALTVVRQADSADHWTSAGPMTPIGSRAALAGHLRSVSRRRIAEMSPEERREALAAHRSPAGRRGPYEALGSVGAGSALTNAVVTRPSSSAPRPRPVRASSITNNQVADVDEGDIVKASGEDLIILRRGHLFRVSLANNGVRRVGHAPAFAPATRPGDWYDELIVDGDIALVLGYSYRVRATEVNRFRLHEDGSIRYVDSFYVRSNDYYSSENYATRLVNGKLVIYTPMSLENDDVYDTRFRLPSVRVGRSGPFRETVNFSRVFASRADPNATTLHTVLTCDVHAPRVSCNAQGVLGGASRTFYVSSTAVYVWAQETGLRATAGDNAPGASWIVRMPFAADQAPGAARVRGGPADQFAFDERGGALHVLLRSEGRGDGMWSSLGARGDVLALRIALAKFSGVVSDASADAYTAVMALPSRGRFTERWVGEYALFGLGRLQFESATGQPGALPFFAYRASDQRLFSVRVGHGIERLEPLGSHALAVGNDGSTLVLTPVALDGAQPATMPALRIAGRAQGETRSHGFFFNPSGPRDGIFGIATADRSDTMMRQLSGASDVSFFRVAQLALAPIGTLSSRALPAARCTVSCADWYGNTRPIFWRSRSFALMGDELVEAMLLPDAVSERARVDYGEGVRSVIASEDQEQQ